MNDEPSSSALANGSPLSCSPVDSIAKPGHPASTSTRAVSSSVSVMRWFRCRDGEEKISVTRSLGWNTTGVKNIQVRRFRATDDNRLVTFRSSSGNFPRLWQRNALAAKQYRQETIGRLRLVPATTSQRYGTLSKEHISLKGAKCKY